MARGNVNLANLVNGFKISGAFAGDNAGISVRSAGDINGDNIAYIIIGASNADPNGRINAGIAYIIYGKKGGLSDIDLLNLNPLKNGFKISGAFAGDNTGISVSGAGDINGDKIHDIIIGAPNADPNNRSDAGAAFVIYGNRGYGKSSDLNDIDLSNLTSTAGFKISGAFAGDNTGISVSGAGDINGDKIHDIIIGAPNADPNGKADAGTAYVIYGKSGNLNDIDLLSLTSKYGFKIFGDNAGDNAGISVSRAGDVNGDKIADLIVGAHKADIRNGVEYTRYNTRNPGVAYVVYSKKNGLDNIDLSSLTLANGFMISGYHDNGQAARSVSNAGDINGDGIDDIIVGQYNAAYIVYGARFPNSVSLRSFDGFWIAGFGNRKFDISVSSAGDINGDKITDLIIGSPYNPGAAYVVFGKSRRGRGTVITSQLTSNEFKISGAKDGDNTGSSVSSAGDVNGDGVDDIIIGASQATPSGRANAGAAYIVYGVKTIIGTSGDDVIAPSVTIEDIDGLDGIDTLNYATSKYNISVNLLTGIGVADYGYSDSFTNFENIIGSNFSDSLTGDDNANNIQAGDGDDVVEGGAGADTLDGGTGNDTVSYTTSAEGVAVDIATDTVSGGDAEGDIIVNFENIVGSGFNDDLTGNDKANSIQAGNGDDVVEGGAGADTLDGCAGVDTLSYATSKSGVTVNIATNKVSDGDAEGDSITGFENIIGSDSDDTLTGNGENNFIQAGDGDDVVDGGAGVNVIYGDTGNDRLYGGPGEDVLDGGEGDDILSGGEGSDTYTGGLGADTFIIAVARGITTITDFSSQDKDKIDLSDFNLDFAKVESSAENEDNGCSIQLGGKTIILKGVKEVKDVIESWFIFTKPASITTESPVPLPQVLAPDSASILVSDSFANTLAEDAILPENAVDQGSTIGNTIADPIQYGVYPNIQEDSSGFEAKDDKNNTTEGYSQLFSTTLMSLIIGALGVIGALYVKASRRTGGQAQPTKAAPASGNGGQAKDSGGVQSNKAAAQSNSGDNRNVVEIRGQAVGETEWVILQIISWLDIDFIPVKILSEFIGSHGIKSLPKLELRSLINIMKDDGGGGGIKADKAVQDEIVRYVHANPDKSKDISQLVDELLQTLVRLFPESTDDPKALEIAKLYEKSIESLLTNAKMRKINFAAYLVKEIYSKLASIYSDAGISAIRSQNINGAIPLYERGLMIAQLYDGGNNSESITILGNMIKAYQSLGDQANEQLYTAMLTKVELATERAAPQEAKGQGTLNYAANNYPEYYSSGIDQILKLRIDGLGIESNLDVKLLKSRLFTKELSFAISQTVNDVSVALSSDNAQVILAPFSLYNEHWLGLLFRKQGAFVEVTYMDSEQGALLPKIRDGLEVGLSVNGYRSKFSELRLEKQSYNNCGSELIENFVYYLTGNRATQEGALYVHSLLSENSLLDPSEYGLQIQENSKLIGFLSNAAPISIRSIDLFQNAKSATIRHGRSSTAAREVDLLPAIKQFNKMWTKWVQDKLYQVNSVVYKTNVGFKGLDLAVDSARLIHQPNLANSKKIALDSSYLYGMYSGVNGYSLAISGAEAAYQISLGEYQQAFNIVATTVSAMALPYILMQVGNPYLSLAYGTVMALYTVGNAISNAYELTTELMAEDAALKSAVAYKDLFECCAASPLQAVYDFKADVINYKLKVNAILSEKEKSEAKAQVKPEVDQKVFDDCTEATGVDGHYDCYNRAEQLFDQVTIADNNGIALLDGLDM